MGSIAEEASSLKKDSKKTKLSAEMEKAVEEAGKPGHEIIEQGGF